MKYRFHPRADKELSAAADYYDDKAVGLGYEFLEEVYAAIQRILEFPEAWTPLSKRTRRCLLSRFPYGVIYQIRSDYVLIVAVANLQKEPDYWVDRLN